MDIAAIILAVVALLVIPIAGPIAALPCVVIGLALGVVSLVRRRSAGGRVWMPIVGLGVGTFAFIVCLSVISGNWDADVETPSDVVDSEDATISLTAPGKQQWFIKPSAKRYHEILEFVSGYPQDKFGTYLLTVSAYEKLESDFDMRLRPEEAEKARRWREQSEVHWPNVNAFLSSVKDISEDRIVDMEELGHVCFAHEQWTAQMTEARDYVREYRKTDPQLLDENPSLLDLQSEAERALALLAKVECR